jgi:hypothetical protein
VFAHSVPPSHTGKLFRGAVKLDSSSILIHHDYPVASNIDGLAEHGNTPLENASLSDHTDGFGKGEVKAVFAGLDENARQSRGCRMGYTAYSPHDYADAIFHSVCDTRGRLRLGQYWHVDDSGVKNVTESRNIRWERVCKPDDPHMSADPYGLA